jgi:hypothetical protein
MSFLYPAFLIGGLAIALPIVLHLLRRDIAPEVPFTAVRLLQHSPVDNPARQRLREWLLLAARVVALLLLAGAFARPYVQGATPPEVHVVAIDRSYSMGGPERFARALERARAAIDSTPRGARVAVIAFDDRPDVVAVPGGAADARAAVTGVTVGFGATHYEPVFGKATELAAGARGHLVVITDLQRGGWEGSSLPALPAGWTLDVQDIGPASANVAVTAIGVEPDRLLATIRNDSDSAVSGQARALLDGRDVAQAPYSLPPRGSASVPITWNPPPPLRGYGEAATLSVAIDDPHGLPADNTRYVSLGARRAAKVLIVTSGGQSGIYLARALGTSGGEEGGLDTEVAPGGRLGEISIDAMAGYPAIALLSTRGVERTAREHLAAYVRQGGGLLMIAGPDLEAAVISTLAEWQPAWSAQVDPAGAPAMTFASTDGRHPIFRPFGALSANLGQVRFERRWRVQPDGWSVVARFSDGAPALLERALGTGRVVLFASDLDRRWNDFPLNPSFVPFAIETVRYAAGATGGGDRRRPREYTVAHVPAGVPQTPGPHRTPDGRIVSVNVDPREGSSDRLTREGFLEMVQRSSEDAATATSLQARQTESHQSYWQYGLLIMLAALVAESFVGRS